MSDALSDILQQIRLTSTVYFQRDFHLPWAMKIENTGFAQFHVVTRGACVVSCNGRSYDCFAGDVLLFPRGASHVLADKTGRDAVDGPEVMASFSGDEPYFAKGGTATRLVCGHYEYATMVAHPLIDDLPDLVHVSSAEGFQEAAGISVLPLVLNELVNEKPGQSLIVERFAEILLIQTLREYYKQSPQERGFYAGLANRQLARAISHIHREFSSSLTLSDLADQAAMSRSSFAKHFKQTTNISPIEYLAKWRMINAGNYLRATDYPVATVAESVGYDSAISFARAFNRQFGVTPSEFRKTKFHETVNPSD